MAPEACGQAHSQRPTSSRTDLRISGWSVMIPSTPSWSADRISRSLLTVHTCTWMPALCARLTIHGRRRRNPATPYGSWRTWKGIRIRGNHPNAKKATASTGVAEYQTSAVPKCLSSHSHPPKRKGGKTHSSTAAILTNKAPDQPRGSHVLHIDVEAHVGERGQRGVQSRNHLWNAAQVRQVGIRGSRYGDIAAEDATSVSIMKQDDLPVCRSPDVGLYVRVAQAARCLDRREAVLQGLEMRTSVGHRNEGAGRREWAGPGRTGASHSPLTR